MYPLRTLADAAPIADNPAMPRSGTAGCAGCDEPIRRDPIDDHDDRGAPYHRACWDRRTAVLRAPIPEALADWVMEVFGRLTT